MFGLGYPEIMVVLGLGVLLFGKRLPEVGRSLGKGIVEFKKGLNGVDDGHDAASSSYARPSEPTKAPDGLETTVPKFEPPTSAPVLQGGEAAHTSYP